MKNETGCYSYQVNQARIKHALDVVGWKYYCLKCILYVLCSGFIFFFHLILSVTLSDLLLFLAKNVFCCDCAVSDFYLYVENTVNRLIHYYCQEPEDEACSVHSRIIMLYFSACEFLTNNTPSTSRMPSFECIRKKNF